MASSSTGISSTLFSKSRLGVLSLLFVNSGRRYYMRQIVRLTRLGVGAVQRELAALTSSGILKREPEGRQVYYQANPECPVFAELKAIIVKTGGVADVLRERLAGIAKQCRVAFVYGSFAQGQDDAESDIDVMVIGDVSFAEVADALAPTQQTLGREVNPSVYPPREFRRKLKAKHPFLTSVANGPKIFLIGDEHDVTGLA